MNIKNITNIANSINAPPINERPNTLPAVSLLRGIDINADAKLVANAKVIIDILIYSNKFDMCFVYYNNFVIILIVLCLLYLVLHIYMCIFYMP